MLTLIHTTILLTLLYIGAVFIRDSCFKKYYYIGALFKLVATIALGLLYSHYYQAGDTLSFHQDLITMQKGGTALNYAYEPRTMFFLKLVSPLSAFANNDYWIISFYMSIICYFSTWFLVLQLNCIIPNAQKLLLLAFVFLPSLLFWGAGLLKESLSTTLIFLIVAMLIQLRKSIRFKMPLLISIVGLIWVLFKFKYYFAISVGAISLSYYLSYLISSKYKLRFKYELLCFLLFLIITVFIGSLTHYNLQLHHISGVVRNNLVMFLTKSTPDKVINFYYLDAGFLFWLVNIPVALIHGLFAPFPWQVKNGLMILQSVECQFLLFLMMRGMYMFKKSLRYSLNLEVIALITYVLILAILLPLAAPNYGSLSRYKIAYSPFFVLLVLLLNNDLIGRLSLKKYFYNSKTLKTT